MCCHCRWCTLGGALCTWNSWVDIYQNSSGALRRTGPARADHAPSALGLRPLVVLWMHGAMGVLYICIHECAGCPLDKHGGHKLLAH